MSIQQIDSSSVPYQILDPEGNLVGEMPDHRLQQRCGELERQRDHSDLRKVQRIARFQDRINGRNQRLHGVVEKVRNADAAKYDVGRPRCRRVPSNGRRHVRQGHRRDQGFFGYDNWLVQRIIPDRFATREQVSYDGAAMPTSTIRK